VIDDLDEHDNCPGTVVIYCEDENGIRYRYERIRGQEPIVKAKEDASISDVPVDAFRVEYYPQGELSKVAKDPIRNPKLLQDFLDRHLLLGDLTTKEQQIRTVLEQNGAQLIPLEGNAAQLSAKEKSQAEINKKLEIAEQGKLKEIAAAQTQLSNEKAFATSLGEIRNDYVAGLTVSDFLREYDEYEADVIPLTSAPASIEALGKVKLTIAAVNEELRDFEKAINSKLSAAAKEITTALSELNNSQKSLEAQLNAKVTALQKKGLSGNVAELNALLKRKTAISQDIAKIKTQASQLRQVRDARVTYLRDLEDVRAQITQRRKDQLKSINDNLSEVIQDYTVFIHYDPSGIY
jgi:hypothetical protein